MNKVLPYQQIADYFIALANETQTPVTNLKLQKLVYYAQAWSLALLKEPLINEDFEAWVHGPVLPALYHQYKAFGWKPIERDDLQEGSVNAIIGQFQQKVQKLLSDVQYEYFGLSAFELEKLTHNEAPWQQTRDGLPDDAPSDRVIPKDLMQAYYSRFIVADEQD